ncbi:hypothetical protein SPWS13_2507 [Shewanella putrefaciens]|nr:hypothetical protein SPWS13_2507 [Shewanella putrefaciens]
MPGPSSLMVIYFISRGVGVYIDIVFGITNRVTQQVFDGAGKRFWKVC